MTIQKLYSLHWKTQSIETAVKHCQIYRDEKYSLPLIKGPKPPPQECLHTRDLCISLAIEKHSKQSESEKNQKP